VILDWRAPLSTRQSVAQTHGVNKNKAAGRLPAQGETAAPLNAAAVIDQFLTVEAL
jgi:hypothetical protein